MLRHRAQATWEYRSGSQELSEFGSAKPQGNDAVTLHLRALTQFEHAIFHCDRAVSLSHAIARCIDASTPEKHFEAGKDTPEERLRDLCNKLKHFNDPTVDANFPNRVAPVWITSEGLRSVLKGKNGEAPVVKTLKFEEMAQILKDLSGNAKFLAEEVYRLAHDQLRS